MSVKVSRDELSADQIDAIIKHLNLQPKKESRRKSNYYYTAPTDPPIQFFEVDHQTNEVIVPYTFYRGLTQNQPNANKVYLQVPYDFIGNLFEVQAPIAEDALDQLTQYGTTTLNLHTNLRNSEQSLIIQCVFRLFVFWSFH